MRHRVVAWAALVSSAVSRFAVPVPAVIVVAFAAFALAEIAHASPPPSLSLLALPMAGGSEAASVGTCGPSAASAFSAAQGIAPRLESVRWRPRYPRGGREPAYRDREPSSQGFSQIHAGFLDPDGPENAGLVLGYRGGLAVDPNIQIGGMVDWRHSANSETAVISEGVGPGGTVITTRADLARSSSDLVPLLAFAQVSAGGMSVVPYLGVAGGYEVLHLSAEDFLTGREFRGTFGGFGWQVWSGVALPLSGRSRLTAEVFVNRAELSRDVTDALTGQDFRETVNADGSGMRFGLQWGF